MNSIFQKTLSKNVIFEGVGLHSGKSSTVNITPAKEDTGIIFRQSFLKNTIHYLTYT